LIRPGVYDIFPFRLCFEGEPEVIEWNVIGLGGNIEGEIDMDNGI